MKTGQIGDEEAIADQFRLVNREELKELRAQEQRPPTLSEIWKGHAEVWRQVHDQAAKEGGE